MSLESTSICPFCDEKFDPLNIKKHIGIDHLGLSHEENDQTFAPKVEIKKEIKESDEEQLCELCGTTFNSFSFQTHNCESSLNINQEVESNLCEDCGKTFLGSKLNHFCEPSISLNIKTEPKQEIECKPEINFDYSGNYAKISKHSKEKRYKYMILIRKVRLLYV